MYRLAYVKIQDILKIFAELKGGSPEEALRLIHDLVKFDFEEAHSRAKYRSGKDVWKH